MVMKNTIIIENPQVKTKLINFIKTCDTLLSKQKEIDRTQQAVSAFKVLLRFLKNDSDLCDVYSKFDMSKSITEAYELAQTIVANDFSIVVDDISDEVQDDPQHKYKIGDIVAFGKKIVRESEQPLTWKVLRENEDKVLLFAEKSHLWEPFDSNGGSDWQASSLRKLLNDEWYNETFSDAEKASIVLYDNDDLIFVPTLDELMELIPDSTARCDSKAAWWTSSPTEAEGMLESIQRNGEVQTEGVLATKKQGVRPAFWIVNSMEVHGKEDDREEVSVTTLPERKVIIVDNGDDYYIAYATPQDSIRSGFLKSFSAGSVHFKSLDEAYEAVEVIKNISVGKYETTVSHIVLNDLLNQEYEAANQKYIITDQDGYPIVHIDSKGKKAFPIRDEDVACRLIDKLQYEVVIKQMMEHERTLIDDNFDYYNIGALMGYTVALDCDVTHVRYEIFKAYEVIDSFNEFPDLKDTHLDDEKY